MAPTRTSKASAQKVSAARTMKTPTASAKAPASKKEKAAFVSATLAELYPRTSIPLDHEDPYTLLVAVVLSAQCTDKKVNEITPMLF